MSSVKASPKLADVIATNSVLDRFAKKPLKENGVTIEGIAVRGQRAFIGFRAPHLEHGRAARSPTCSNRNRPPRHLYLGAQARRTRYYARRLSVHPHHPLGNAVRLAFERIVHRARMLSLGRIRLSAP